MANPMYGQNKADELLATLTDAVANIATAGTGADSAGEAAKADCEKVLPIVIDGTTYYIGLWASNAS